ncbi:MAG: PVC-type heme-binding CxxCH protein [Akkermansiaceae bacterium]
MKHLIQLFTLLIALSLLVIPVHAKKKILFLAGPPSHGNGEHEFRAGCMLLADALNESGLDVEAKVHWYGWPKDESIFDGVDACIIYADAGGRLGNKVEFLDEKVKSGMGIMFMHYGVHPSKEVGEKYFKHWIGGYMETGWSVNPHWIADMTAREKHPVSNGLDKPITAYDEFYWNMRFPTKDECQHCYSLATAIPTPDRVVRYINLWNEYGEKCFGTEQALMWCRDPEPGKGGRGIGFVGGHYHRNWAIDDFRKLVLNSIVWLARAEIPEGGVPSKPVTLEMLNANLDRPVEGKPVQLPTPDLLKQKPMAQPDLKARAAAKLKAEQAKERRDREKAASEAKKKTAPVSNESSSLIQSPKLRASGQKRSHLVSVNIKGLAQIQLHVSDLGSKDHDWANWINPTFIDANGESTAIEKKHVASATQAWGSLKYNLNVENKPLIVDGKKYDTGLGTHASSTIVLNVPANAVTFTALAGLDDGGALRNGKPTSAAVRFSVHKPGPITHPIESEWESDHEPEYVKLDQFSLPDDLEVSIWATSPYLYNPTNMDIDHKGRIWVAEGVNYRRHNGRRPGGDRIAVLEDTDGDGKCDKSHTFVQEKGLVAPLGVAVFDNVIYVSQPPELLVYTDVNRDLKFDPAVDKREVLLTGFNAGNHDHSLHSLTAGPDGKFYFNNGNCGAVFKDRSGKNFYMGGPYKGGGGVWYVDHLAASGKRSDDGHIWSSGFTVRMNPDGTDCEIVGQGYRNSYEQSLDSFGNAFQNDNDDPPACRVSYILEYGSAGYFTRDAKQLYRSVKRPGQNHGSAHWRQLDPGTMDVGHIYGGGSPTGVTMYENGALPERFNGAFFSAEPGKNTIFHYHPEPQGATFKLEQGNLITSNPDKKYAGSDFVGRGKGDHDQNKILFRPSDISVGPDGAIYICDWYDPRVGGHGDSDRSCSGTIYRIAPKGFKSKVSDFDLKTVDGAITALSSPAINTRYLGFRALKKHGAKTLPALNKLLKHSNKHIAARAIWLLPHLGDQGKAECVKLLSSAQPHVRLTAYRALRRINPIGSQGTAILPYAKQLANDPDPGVRRDVALSLRDLPAEQTKAIFAILAPQVDHTDKNAIEAIGLGAANQENEIWLAIKQAMQPGEPHEWSDQFARLTWRLWPSVAVSDLKARALHPSLSPEARSFAVESLAFINHKASVDAMLELADNDRTKADASFWLLRNGLGEWKAYNIAGELKTRGIYDPSKIKPVAVTVPAPTAKPSYKVEDVLALKGDIDRGRATMTRCIMCHQVGEPTLAGPSYGPALKAWGIGQPSEVIARAIIEPSHDIAHGYGGKVVKLKAGGEIHGLITSESDPVIIKSTGGQTQMIPRGFIDGRPHNLNRSLMLSADQLGLSAQDVADIVAYMRQWR